MAKLKSERSQFSTRDHCSRTRQTKRRKSEANANSFLSGAFLKLEKVIISFAKINRSVSHIKSTFNQEKRFQTMSKQVQPLFVLFEEESTALDHTEAKLPVF